MPPSVDASDGPTVHFVLKLRNAFLGCLARYVEYIRAQVRAAGIGALVPLNTQIYAQNGNIFHSTPGLRRATSLAAGS